MHSMNQQPETKPPTVYAVLRIPKSGSTSLADAMIGALKPPHVFSVNSLVPDAHVSRIERLRALRKLLRRRWKAHGVLSEEAMWRKIDARLTDGDVLTGHFTYGYLRLKRPELRYVTLVREPLRQFISEFKWMRHGYAKRNALRRMYQRGRNFAATSPESFLRFLDSHSDLYRNPATRYITGDPDHPDPFGHLQDSFFAFGILEESEVFCAEFEQKTGVSVTLPHLNLSPSPTNESLSGASLALFEKLYAKDIELHARIKAYALSRKR